MVTHTAATARRRALLTDDPPLEALMLARPEMHVHVHVPCCCVHCCWSCTGITAACMCCRSEELVLLFHSARTLQRTTRSLCCSRCTCQDCLHTGQPGRHSCHSPAGQHTHDRAEHVGTLRRRCSCCFSCCCCWLTSCTCVPARGRQQG